MFGLSYLSSIGKVAMTGARGISSVTRLPFIGSAIKAIPFVGTAATITSLGVDAYRGFGGSDSPSTPSIPIGSALPPIPFNPPATNNRPMVGRYGSANMPTRAPAPNSTIQAVQNTNMNNLSMYGGKGKHHGIAPAQAFQMLMQMGVGLGPNYWKQKLMAPPGYVMVKNPLNPAQVIAVPKKMAIQAGLWKAHAKPPISVRQWHAIKNAKIAIKHLHKVEKAAHIVTKATTKHKAEIVHHKRKK